MYFVIVFSSSLRKYFVFYIFNILNASKVSKILFKIQNTFFSNTCQSFKKSSKCDIFLRSLALHTCIFSYLFHRLKFMHVKNEKIFSICSHFLLRARKSLKFANNTSFQSHVTKRRFTHYSNYIFYIHWNKNIELE